MPATASKTYEIHLVRTYDAPLDAVWDAWTDPVQVAKWWGPRGFTITTHSKDLRPGGHWYYTMHGPDGTDYENTTVYHEVVPKKKLVYDHGGHRDRPPMFQVTVLFSASRGRTTLDMRMVLPSAEALEEARAIIRKAGGNSTWDRLGEYLEHESSGRDIFIINRSFEAPRVTVFAMWTNPEHFASWLPPTGFSMEFLRADIRVGGSAFFRMSNGKDVSFHGSMAFLEVDPPNRIVYTQDFRDADGGVSRHPGTPLWPESMKTTVQFTEEGANQTRITLTWEPQGTVKPAELAAFVAERGGMSQGWTGSFDALESLLSAGVS